MGKVMFDYLEVNKIRTKGRVYVYYYYRRDGRRLEKLPDINDPRFSEAYQAADDAANAADEKNAAAGERHWPSGTLGHLIATFKKSPEYVGLAEKTRKSYARYLDAIEDKNKAKRVATMPRSFIYKERNRYASNPRTANYVVAVMSRLLSFAIDQHQETYKLRVNPAAKVGRLDTGDGYRPWEEYEVKAYRDKWAVGTRQRLELELFLNTGQRGSDVINMGRPHYNGVTIFVAAQEKTGERVEIPASNDLKGTLDPWLDAHGHMIFLTGDKGAPMTVDYLRHEFREACRDAKLADDCTLHGLRYTAGVRLRDLGCDWPTIGDILGHRTMEMVRKYSEKKRRTKLAIAKLNRATRQANENERGSGGNGQ